MAMSKKGTRKIVVNGAEYRYKIKKSVKLGPSVNGASLTVEFPDGKYHTAHFDDGPVTPSMVAAFIENR